MTDEPKDLIARLRENISRVVLGKPDAVRLAVVALLAGELETIVVAFQRGATAEEIAQQYPTVLLSDVYAAIAYYLRPRP